jgi:hypothetical protein
MDKQQIAIKRLPELAKLINRSQKGIEGAAKDVLRNARSMGDNLREARTYVEKGGWTAWVEENCSVSYRQASKYMQLAERWDDIEAKCLPGQICDMGINDALASIAEPKTPSNDTQPPKAKKPSERDSKLVQGEIVDLDAEPREGFNGYNTDLEETPRVFVQEFRDLWEEADESGRLAITVFALDLPEFTEMFGTSAPKQKKPTTKKPAKKKAAKKRTRKKVAK